MEKSILFKLAIILTLMHLKGESFEEIYSFVKYLKYKSSTLKLKEILLIHVGRGVTIKIVLISQLRPQFSFQHLILKLLNMEIEVSLQNQEVLMF